MRSAMRRTLFVLTLFALAVPAGAANDMTATITCPAKVFRDETLTGQVEVTNRGKDPCPGAIYLKYTGQKTFTKIINDNWRGAPGEKNTYSFSVLPFNYEGLEGGKSLQIIYRDEKLQDTVLANGSFDVIFQRLPRRGENVLPNASFELDGGFNGSWFGTFDCEMATLWQGSTWKGLNIDGWWANGNSREGVDIVAGGRTGARCMKISDVKGPRSVTSAAGYYVPKGSYTLSAYIKTQGAAGSIHLGFVTGLVELKQGRLAAGKEVALPSDAKDWTRISVTVDCPETLMAMASAGVSKGTLLIDDIQVEAGTNATAFNISPREWLRLSFAGIDDPGMPKWIAREPAKRVIGVHNDSRLPLSGTVTVHLGPWNAPDLITLGELKAADLPEGQAKGVEFSTAGLRPDGYLVSVRLRNGLAIHDGIWDFDPQAYTAWGIRPMLHSRSVARFALIPPMDPKKLFGIGNTAIRMSAFWQNRGYLQFRSDVRDIGLSCIRGIDCSDNECFLNAASGGVAQYAMYHYDAAPANSGFANPCNPSFVDVYDPNGIQYIIKQAEDLGRNWAANPMLAGVQLANEQYWANGGIPCPSKYADDAFREWCRKRHGDLKTLNERWGTNYTAWDQVDQVISEKFYKDMAAKKAKENATMTWGTLRWGQSWPKESIDEMDRLPGKTMDWFRWRTETGVDSYRIFRDAAHKYDSKTLYTTDLPIPTFRKEFFIPFTRAMDAIHINSRYTSGYEMSFGTPHEHMCDMEMGESLAREQNKPFWGIEIYQKPFWPAESAALQNWGLIAHGMNVAMIFSWGPFSDTGIPKNILAWNERKKKDTGNIFDQVCWYMIDVDNSRMPAFDPYVRSVQEIRQYHERFDGTSILRAGTDIAYYVSNDTCEHNLLTTRYTPWASVSERSCYTLLYLLRLNGITADFVDDTTLPDKPGAFRTVVVSLSQVLSQPAATKLANFTREGGTVVVVGTSGRLDPWLRKYDVLGGPAWGELGWKAPEYKEEFGPYVFDGKLNLSTQPGHSATETTGKPEEKRDDTVNENKVFRGVNLGAMAGAEPLMDTRKQTIGWKRSWGKGKFIAYGICPDVWTRDPHLTPNLAAWTRQMIEASGLTFTGRWSTIKADDTKGTSLGTGAPAVDLVVRVKSPNEKFIFVLNQGGSGQGRVEVPVGPGTWRAEDIIQPQASIEGTVGSGLWQAQLSVNGLGYRVVRLYKDAP